MALKKQGVPAEFVRYPRSTHELSRSGEPWLLVDRLAGSGSGSTTGSRTRSPIAAQRRRPPFNSDPRQVS